jgi:choline dehydrogenase-like flavoprotein
MAAREDVESFQAIVVGTGFGGAVTACRLVEAGVRICILERGRRYGPEDFPEIPTRNLFVHEGEPEQESGALPLPDFSRLLWDRDQGIYEIRDLGDALSVQAAGYGGGSLVYANVHLRPPRDVFGQGWPDVYQSLDPYFDLAAYMLQATAIPKRLAKTLQLERAAAALGQPDPSRPPRDGNIQWFRTPLAVNFEGTDRDEFGHERHACDMRGRCWLGCDLQAKNTLDLNYLARAERGSPAPDIRTLAEVTRITRDDDGRFTVTYKDHLFRDASGTSRKQGREVPVRADYVFLCAGAVNTTELLLKNPRLWARPGRRTAINTPLGSHYFPNADSFSVVFDCDEPHEGDYGPTITSAFRFHSHVKGSFSHSIDFERGRLANGNTKTPAAGDKVTGLASGATAELSHDPILDWGHWKPTAVEAVGALVVPSINGTFAPGEPLEIRDVRQRVLATAVARSSNIPHDHWFLAEDGGYPSDLEPLLGLFRSPLWIRRNRYLELESDARVRQAPLRSAPAPRFRVEAVANAVGGTVRRAAAPGGMPIRFFGLSQSPFALGQPLGQGRLPIGDLLGDNLQKILPDWFVLALQNDRSQVLRQAAAAALPLIGRMLDAVSRDLASQLDPDTLSEFNFGSEVAGVRREVIIRGMLRQALQVVAGSEAAIADKAVQQIGAVIPGTLEQLLERVGTVILWALGYRAYEGHTGMILTMGRDLYRGKLSLAQGRLTARLPGQLLDPSGVMQERVLRTIAKHGWHGELRTNPAWTPLGNRVTVHSQGGCPMSDDREHGVTDPLGAVYGCPGLYVMDAAAFPTSVGVNPSATIAAVAEFKVEQFIRSFRHDPGWVTVDKVRGARWIAARRTELDPLNPAPDLNLEPEIQVLGLTFQEKMTGFYAGAGGPVFNWDDLSTFPKNTEDFTTIFEGAEDTGIANGDTIDAHLNATIVDLSEFLALAAAGQPGPIGITHNERLRLSTIGEFSIDAGHLRLFVAPPARRTPPVLFMRYKLGLLDRGQKKYSLNGLKVLHDQPGFDVWHDTSTVYFEVSDGARWWRGIMRVPAQDFLETQLPSMTVTGTTDPARMSWALTSFYRYFAGELSQVYIRRQRDLWKFLGKVLTATSV